MDLRWCSSGPALDALAADRVAALLTRQPTATLALPTGLTPLGLYAELVSRVSAGGLSFARSRLFNLDEYVGRGADDALSYAHYIRRYLAEPAQVPRAQLRLLQGDAADLRAECRAYDLAIAAAGGLDLAILGLGENGHIAFNEPGTAWHTTTHIAMLCASTRAANAKHLPHGAQVPARGMTMGIATLRAARAILLLVTGDSKRRALAALQSGVPDLAWPVTALADHPQLTVLADAGLSAP